MPEEMKTAQPTDGAMSEGSGINGNADVDKGSENVNDAEFNDSAEDPKSEDAAKEADKDVGNKTQTKEQNSENARRRREAERQAELKRVEAEAREKAIIETLGGKNPYTNEEMKDSTDVAEYLAMREIEKNGGDPLADFSKYRKEKEREKAAEEAKKEERAEWFRRDGEDFAAKHPEVNIKDLLRDPNFQKYADGKVGERPLSEIYEGFIELVSEYEKKAKEKAAQLLANSKASPGALSSTSQGEGVFFTREQVQKMSQAEVSKNYDKIRASMKKWK